MDASYPAKENDTARIISEYLITGQGRFSLWYHMHGENIGSLVIYMSTKTHLMKEINRIYGEQGNQWKKLNTDIGIALQEKEWIQIIIEGVVGSGFQGIKIKKGTALSLSITFLILIFLGDIAIDDIIWSPNVTYETTTTTTTTTPATPYTGPPTTTTTPYIGLPTTTTTPYIGLPTTTTTPYTGPPTTTTTMVTTTHICKVLFVDLRKKKTFVFRY